MNKKTSRVYELIRFLICGVVSALTDYIFCQLVILLLPNTWDRSLITILSTAVGFLFGVLVNYLISTFWVYQNVDKSIKTKSTRFITLFVLLSFGAMLLSVSSMYLCDLFVHNVFSYSIVDLSIMELIKDNGILFLTQGIFWAYFVSFVIKTLVGLFFNYFTRKYLLYKEPKNK